MIRTATQSDVPAIAAIERTAFSDPWPPSAFLPLLGPNALVAVRERRVVGYLFARVIADEAEILNVAVESGHRGRGVAGELIVGFFQSLVDKGDVRVFLEVRASNGPALALYRRHGFTQVGRRPDYYVRPREDALVLSRVVTGPTEGA